eukprot:g6487.t1
MAASGTIDKAGLAQLDYLLPDELLFKAIDLVQRKKICRVVARESGRECFQVESSESRSRNKQYLCVAGFCSCHQFQGKVLGGGALFCKHGLAVRLATISGSVTERVVSDEVMATILLDDT